jgi:hypothetical protein
VRDVFAQPANQMPETQHEERSQNHLAGQAKGLPHRRLDHRYQKGGKEERHGGEDGALALHVFAPVIFEYLIDDPIPAGLGGDLAGPLGMRVFVQTQKCALARPASRACAPNASLLMSCRATLRARSRSTPRLT